MGRKVDRRSPWDRPPVNRQPSTMGGSVAGSPAKSRSVGIERDQGIDRSRHGLSRLSLSLEDWTGGTTTWVYPLRAPCCVCTSGHGHSIGHGRKIGHRCPPWVADMILDMGSMAHIMAIMGHGIRIGGLSTNPVGNGVAKSAGLRGVAMSIGGVHKPDGSETG
jgi:hypothetical protein